MKTALEYYYESEVALPSKGFLIGVGVWIAALPDPIGEGDDSLWSCHVIARAVKLNWSTELKEWGVADGRFAVGTHSWLEFNSRLRGAELRLVLDLYPVASMGGPILVDASPSAPWERFYNCDYPYSVDRRVEFDRAAAKLVGPLGLRKKPENRHD
jgi:hypothetical protein